MTESISSNYRVRTGGNVRSADAVLVVAMRQTLTPGSKLTLEFALLARKPCLTVALSDDRAVTVQKARHWIERNAPKVLMVAGSRESKAPGIQKATAELLVSVLSAPHG
jgi:hypothetical protein